MNRHRLMKSAEGIDPVTGRGFVNGYEVVDLGLSNGLLFATCNVGATKETDYGNYYKYGFGSKTYYYDPDEDGYDTYYKGRENPLSSSADTATQVMGSEWRMPTRYELEELINNTYYEWTTINDINGGKFTSNTNPNAYVFFPAAGYYNKGRLYDKYSDGLVWSSTHSGSLTAYNLSFHSEGKFMYGSHGRTYGCSVRGITSLGGGGKLTLFKRILNLFKSLVKKGGEVC